MEEKESKKKAKEENKEAKAAEKPKEKAPKKEEKPEGAGKAAEKEAKKETKSAEKKEAKGAEKKETQPEAKGADVKAPAAGAAAGAPGAEPVKRVKKSVVRVSSGVAHVHSTFNNTIVVISDMSGKVLCWASAGTAGFKGSRKSTPFAASIAAKMAAKKAKDHGMSELSIRLKGPGPGKESAVRSLKTEGFNIKSIYDITPTPHNGCRPRKKRRV